MTQRTNWQRAAEKRGGARGAAKWALGAALTAALAAGSASATMIPPQAAAPTPQAIAAAKVAPRTKVTRLTVEAQPDSTIVNLSVTPHSPEYHSFVLHHPDRWVLDLKDSQDALPREHWKVLNAGISDVRAGQFEPQVVRIVLDLNEPVHPKVMAEGDHLRIAVAAAPEFVGKAVAAPARKRAATGSAATSELAAGTIVPSTKAPATTASPHKDMAPAASEATAATAVPSVPAPVPASVSAPVPATNMPAASLPPHDAMASGATAAPAPPMRKSALAARAAEHFAPVAAPAPAAPAAPERSAESSATPRGQTPPSLMQPLLGITPGTGEPTIYSGEKITLNLKNADLTDFFRLINQISGLNIIVDPAVKGSVTLVLQQVPWDQALDIVLRNNGLGRKLEGDVLYIANIKTLQAQNEEIAKFKQSEAAAAPFVDKVMPLSYAKADDVAKILTSKGFILGENEMVTTDSRTNALILHVHPDTVPAIDALVTRLDRKTPQVEIEARVVAASRNFVRDLGVQLGFGAGNASSAVGGVNNVGAGQTVTGIASPKFPLTTGGLLPLNVNLGAAAPTSGLAFINASSTFRLDAILTAAESKGLGHILSRPKVVTQNNMQAMVQQGVRIPVQTTINNTISVQFFNVTLRLTVTPQITADNTIFMNVDVENDAIDSGIPPVNGIPAIDTQQATTNVLVANGGTVVIGGVMINNNQNTVFQVPFLGSLPVIGNLFKRQSVNNTSQELLFFITPRIVPG